MRQRRARATTALALPSLLLGSGLLAGVVSTTAQAQRASGVGSDAYVLPNGALRFTLAPTFETADERFRTDGGRDPLGNIAGGEYSASRLGVLAAGQSALRELTGLSTARLSFGDIRVVAGERAIIIPLGVEMGLGGRLQLGVLVPLVRTTSDQVAFAEGDTNSTAGLNPAFVRPAARDSNNALVGQLRAAARAREEVVGLPEGGCAGSIDPGCTLVNDTRNAANSLATLYGTNDAATVGSAAVPRLGTTEAAAVDARIAALRAAYGGDASGITYTRPVHAVAPLTVPELDAFVGSHEVGLGLDAFGPVERTHVGDVEASIKLKLVDGIGALGSAPSAALGFRASVMGVVRAPTGQGEQPGNALDVGTGDGQTDVELRATVDVTVGHAFWVSASGRFVRQMKDDQFVRAPLSVEEGVLAPPTATVRTHRDLGDAAAFELTPRWLPNDYLSIAAMYQLRSKEADVYTQVGTLDDAARDVALVGVGTGYTEHRAGIGATWSTLAAARRGKRVPALDVSLLRIITLSAREGTMPDLSTTQVSVRLWFGATHVQRPTTTR